MKTNPLEDEIADNYGMAMRSAKDGDIGAAMRYVFALADGVRLLAVCSATDLAEEDDQ